MNRNALLVFVKNMVYGQVKTRLAASVGNEKALNIYRCLVKHTSHVASETDADKFVFYADEIEAEDVWESSFSKYNQQGNDLGERMRNAFNIVLKKGFNKAVIIGTDCAQIHKKIIEEAFNKLDEYDVVIGPAADGGYYLLGIKYLHNQLFSAIEWSTDKVLQTTMHRCRQDNLSFFLLDELHDVDEEKDLLYMNHLL